jgi:prepilin-type processing-associated H-X9-DG protein
MNYLTNPFKLAAVRLEEYDSYADKRISANEMLIKFGKTYLANTEARLEEDKKNNAQLDEVSVMVKNLEALTEAIDILTRVSDDEVGVARAQAAILNLGANVSFADGSDPALFVDELSEILRLVIDTLRSRPKYSTLEAAYLKLILIFTPPFEDFLEVINQRLPR